MNFSAECHKRWLMKAYRRVTKALRSPELWYVAAYQSEEGSTTCANSWVYESQDRLGQVPAWTTWEKVQCIQPRPDLSETKLRRYCPKGQVRSKRQKMGRFTSNWLILSFSSQTAGGEIHWPMNSLHLKPNSPSPGCSLEWAIEKAIRLAEAKHGHHGGGNRMDARKGEVANDSAAAWRSFLSHTVWQQGWSWKMSLP